jgi:hypothetical protein
MGMIKFLARNERRKRSVQDNERNYEKGQRKIRKLAQKGASRIQYLRKKTWENG